MRQCLGGRVVGRVGAGRLVCVYGLRWEGGGDGA